MTAKEYLSKAYNIQQRLKRLQRQRDELRNDLYSVKSPSFDPNKVQTSIEGDKMAALVARVDELERDIVEEVHRLIEEKDNIAKHIERIPNERQKEILFERYIQCHKFEQIAIDHDKGIRWIYRVHGNALKAFENVINDH